MSGVFLGSNILHSIYAAKALRGRGLLNAFAGPTVFREGPVSGLLPRRLKETRVFPPDVLTPVHRLVVAEMLAKGLRRTGVSFRHQHLASRAILDASMARLVRSSDAGVVHVNSAGLVSTFGAAEQKGAFRVSDVRAPHPATVPYDDPISDHLLEEFELADLILVNSSFALQSFLDMGTPASKLAVLPLGVDPVVFNPGSQPRREGARPGSGPLRLLFVGALSHRKGLDLLLEAVEFLDQPVDLRVAGPPADPAISARADSAGTCTVLGAVTRDRLAGEYRAADVFVLPSRSDSYPLVTLEAIASGTPVIVTDMCGTADLVRQHACGLVVRAGDAGALHEAITRLQLDPDELTSLAEGCVRARPYITWEAYGRGLIELYESRILPMTGQR